MFFLCSLVCGFLRKFFQENIDVNVVSLGDFMFMWKFLSFIVEGGCVFFMLFDENIVDVLMFLGKMDVIMLKVKKRSGQCLFFLMENVDGGNGILEK